MENKKMADKAFRVLAGAFKDGAETEDTSAALGTRACFIGLTGMIDP